MILRRSSFSCGNESEQKAHKYRDEAQKSRNEVMTIGFVRNAATLKATIGLTTGAPSM